MVIFFWKVDWVKLMILLVRIEVRLGRVVMSVRESFGENFMVFLEKMKERKWNRERDEMI